MSEQSFVHSPAGIRLAVGLLGPFLNDAGKAEVQSRWGTDVETMFAEERAFAKQIEDHPALHAALGVWVRDHKFPAEAATRLGEFLATLPTDPTQAQPVLDAWAAEHTNGMIPTFPIRVTKDTHAVLASALAVEDTWANRAEGAGVLFKGQPVKGFESQVEAREVRASDDGRSIRATLRLKSGLEMHFCRTLNDAPGTYVEAMALAEDDLHFENLVEPGQPFVTTTETTRQTTDVAVRLPEFTHRSSLDLAADPASWGLVEAMRPHGVPGLGDMEVTDAKQDAFIEVTRTGVRAAAVTAIGILRSANFAPQKTFTQPLVSFDGPFGFAIMMPGHPVPLFLGGYAG